MAIVTAFTSARMLEIENSCIVDGAVDLATYDLMLERKDGTTINAGNVRGPQGAKGDPGTPADWQGTELGANVNLNNLFTAGVYTQSTSSNATLALNYPKASAGLLQVYRNALGNQAYQEYTTYAGLSVKDNVTYKRAYYAGSWSSWLPEGAKYPDDKQGVAIAMTSSVLAYRSGSAPTYSRWGPIVMIRGVVTPANDTARTALATGNGIMIISAATLTAAGIMPIVTNNELGGWRVQGSQSNAWTMDITTDGLRAARYGPDAATGTVWMPFEFMYFAYPTGW